MILVIFNLELPSVNMVRTFAHKLQGIMTWRQHIQASMIKSVPIPILYRAFDLPKRRLEMRGPPKERGPQRSDSNEIINDGAFERVRSDHLFIDVLHKFRPSGR